ncbi:MAG: BamA/TamA family outer membrane protein [Myxococcaceae bacterium]|nr:BamA/TamA family outer membrane protein [Myxococcaceae bacterium]
MRATRESRTWRCLALVALVSACATPKPSPDSLRVDDLTITGMQALKEGDVTDRIVTSATPWWSKWFPFLGGTEWFDVNTWQADLRRIARVYESRGYYQARVLEDLVTETGKGSVTLKVKVSEGVPATLRTVDVTGLDGVSELKPSLLARLPLELGDVFLEEAWAKAKAGLVDQLHEAGFAEADVEGEAVVDLDAAKVDARLAVDPGSRFRFGLIYAPVIGQVVPPKLIIDVAQAELPRGSWYSDSALANAQARVFQMGVFGAVKVNRGIPDRAQNEMPIIIDAREAPLRSVRWGGGAGGDLIRNEARVFGEYVDRNLGFARLFSKGALLDKLTLKGKAGYAVLPNVFEFTRRAIERDGEIRHGLVFDASVQYEVPRVFETRTVSLLSSLGFNRTLDQAFDYFAAEGKLGFLWRPRVDLTVYPSVNLNGYVLRSPIQQMVNANLTPSAALGCPVMNATQFFPKADDLCLLGYLDVTTEWDRRDNKLEPKEGFYLGLSAQGGLSRTTQLTPFLKLVPEARGYVSFGKARAVTLAGKLRAGTLVGFGGGETPIVTRFFSGGSNMRGFNQRRLSPMAVVKTGDGVLPSNELDSRGQFVCQRDDAGNCLTGALGGTVPIGGNGLIEASLEVRIDLTDSLVLAFFVDGGLVTAEPLGPGLDFARDFYTAVGLGLRYRTPLGPIRADLAYRLPFIGGPLLQNDPTKPAYVSQSGCFFNLGHTGSSTYAGAPDSVCAVHLSIGEAF